jgi:hypothetical protein
VRGRGKKGQEGGNRLRGTEERRVVEFVEVPGWVKRKRNLEEGENRKGQT